MKYQRLNLWPFYLPFNCASLETEALMVSCFAVVVPSSTSEAFCSPSVLIFVTTFVSLMSIVLMSGCSTGVGRPDRDGFASGD